MATSPNTSTLQTPKKRDETLFDKIGTLGRKKKVKEGIWISTAVNNTCVMSINMQPYKEMECGWGKTKRTVKIRSDH